MRPLKAIKVKVGQQYHVRVTAIKKSDSILGSLMTEKQADELIEFIESAPDTKEALKDIMQIAKVIPSELSRPELRAIDNANQLLK